MRFGLQSVQQTPTPARSSSRKLCRFLGFGLLGVSSAGSVEVMVVPGPWKPRQNKKRRFGLIDEHRKWIGTLFKADQPDCR